METTITLTGASGKRYVYGLPARIVGWNEVPGNYVMLDAYGRPIYVGETGDFATRQPGPNHPQWKEAIRYGAVAVAARINRGGQDARRAEERDLILAYDPPANQRVPRNGLLGLASVRAIEPRNSLADALLSKRPRGGLLSAKRS